MKDDYNAQIIWTLCFLCCRGQTQNCYEAKEHSNVTLTWNFPENVEMYPQQLNSKIIHVKTQERIFLCDNNVRHEWYSDELHGGRLHCHPQLSFKRRIDCVLTNLSLSHAGTYKCILSSKGKTVSSQLCHLNVTEVSKPENEPELRPTSRERTALYVVLGLFLVVSAAALCVWTLNAFSTPNIQTTI